MAAMIDDPMTVDAPAGLDSGCPDARTFITDADADAIPPFPTNDFGNTSQEQSFQPPQFTQNSVSTTQPESLSSPLSRMQITSTPIPMPSVQNLMATNASSTLPVAPSTTAQTRRPSGIRYAAERVIGNGSFGVVYQASVVGTGEIVAIKKVLQDPKFKNRELQILNQVSHVNIITLRHCFYSKGDREEEIYLNLVMDYIPDTIYRCLRLYHKANRLLPLMTVKCYVFQMIRSIAYIHNLGIAHRDIKPQNILLNSRTHTIKLCDFGSAKVLLANEPNIAYICSRYYRAPELVFEATQYTTAIDIWSIGCVLAEMLLGAPLFPGDSAVDQLVEIVKLRGTPTNQEMFAMNPNHKPFQLAQMSPIPWSKVIKSHVTPDATSLLDACLQYDPRQRVTALSILAHPFFDSLKVPNAALNSSSPLPIHLFAFSETELQLFKTHGISHKVVPAHLWYRYNISEPIDQS